MATFSAVAGTLFKYTVSAALTTIPGVGSASYSGGDRTDIPVTSISDEDEVMIGGRRSAKELSFPMYYDPADAGHVAMLAAYNAATSVAVPCSFVDGDAGACTDTFSAYVKSMSKKYDVDGAIMYDVTLKLTTIITTTP